MRYAPHSLHYPVTRSARAGFFVLVACSMALLPPLLWSLYAGWQGPPQALAIGLLLMAASLACSVLAWRHWQRSAQGMLLWDGAAWHWAAGQQQILESGGRRGKSVREYRSESSINTRGPRLTSASCPQSLRSSPDKRKRGRDRTACHDRRRLEIRRPVQRRRRSRNNAKKAPKPIPPIRD